MEQQKHKHPENTLKEYFPNVVIILLPALGYLY